MKYTTWKVRIFSDGTLPHWQQIKDEKEEVVKIYHGKKIFYLKNGIALEEDPKQSK